MFHLVLVVSPKGGVGKSTLSLAIHDALSLRHKIPAVIQIDQQHRLADALGGDVLTIESDPKAARTDPHLEIRRFSPVLDRIAAVAGQRPILVDAGGGEAERLAAWMALVDLEEELKEWLMPCTVFIPFLSEVEAIRQAVLIAGKVRGALPTANLVFVENRRDGLIANLPPASAAAKVYSEQLKPWLESAKLIVMPAIPGDSWRYLEAANCRFMDLVDMSKEQVMKLTGLPRAEAKIALGDVSQWLVNMLDAFDHIACLKGA